MKKLQKKKKDLEIKGNDSNGSKCDELKKEATNIFFMVNVDEYKTNNNKINLFN